jgi:hypothetical protein
VREDPGAPVVGQGGGAVAVAEEQLFEAGERDHVPCLLAAAAELVLGASA